MLMFQQIVSKLSLSPSALSELTFYARRLKQERVTRTFSAIAAVLIVGLQFATILAPPTPSNAASSSDIIYGGFTSKEDLLSRYDNSAELQALYKHMGISRADIAASSEGSINSKDHTLNSLGRVLHESSDQAVVVGGNTYWARYLYQFDTGWFVQAGSTYKVLQGTRSMDGGYFAAIFHCGNLVFRNIPVPPPPPPPAKFVLGKAALNLTQNIDATTAPAKAGDTIRYTLTTKNTGGTAASYTVVEEITDIREYATVTDRTGATLDEEKNTLTWPAVSIKPGETVTNTFTVQIKNPIPATPVGISDKFSYDLRLDNVYGNAVRILLQPPVVKQVEGASATLPETGPGASTTIVLIVSALVLFFYFRNRQLAAEIRILRHDYHGGAR